MQISAEGTLGILVGLIGLAGAGAIMLAPEQRWIGWTLIAIALTGGIGLGVYAFVEESKLGPLVIIATGLAIFGVGVAWYFRPPGRTAGDHQSTSSSVSLAHLAELGWSLQRQPNGIQFVASGSGPLPDMAKSAPYFAQLPEAFSLLFSGTNGIEGSPSIFRKLRSTASPPLIFRHCHLSPRFKNSSWTGPRQQL